MAMQVKLTLNATEKRKSTFFPYWKSGKENVCV